MPRIPENVTKRFADVTTAIKGRAAPVTKKLRQVDPVAAKNSAAKGVGGAKDIVRLAVAYAKQETVDPVKGLAKYLAWGISGALFMGFGLVLLSLSLLRGIQEHRWGRQTSFAPYLLTALGGIVALGAIAIALKRATASTSRSNGGSQ